MTRLVRIEGAVYRVYEGRQVVAQFEAQRAPSAAEVEAVRVADYPPEPKEQA